MRRRQRYDVCAAVVSHLPFDARVWREARSLADAGYRVALLGCCYDAPKVSRRTEDGITVIEFPFGHRAGRVSHGAMARAGVRLWVEVLRTPARAYHAHNIHTAPAAWLASRLRGAALIYDAHELRGEPVEEVSLPRRSLARLQMSIERFMVRRSTGVLTTNQSRAEVLRHRHGRAHISVLANVPDLSETPIPLDPGYPNGAKTLLYQGGIYARSRAFRETIAALAALEDFSLVILGFGRDADIRLIRRWAAEAGVEDRVRLLGPRPFGELVRTAAAATVGIAPIHADNTNHRLADTNKVHEYLMAGLPVAGSDLPEIRRVLTQGDPPVGELFDPRSPASIATAVRSLVDDPEKYAARRREARRLALQRFNWQAQADELLGIYARALRGPRGHADRSSTA